LWSWRWAAQDRSRQRHSSSHSGLDASAGSRGCHWRETLSVSRPRPRQHLLFRVDSAVEAMGLSILKTPFRAPQANAFCERLVGSIRRECLDLLIPSNERHLRGILKDWVAHYNKGRPHSALGPGILEPSEGIPVLEISGHRIPCGHRVTQGCPVTKCRYEKQWHEAVFQVTADNLHLRNFKPFFQTALKQRQ